MEWHPFTQCMFLRVEFVNDSQVFISVSPDLIYIEVRNTLYSKPVCNPECDLCLAN